MVTVIYVCTGNKYDQWWVDNLNHMIKKNCNDIDYEISGITDGEGSVYDKLKIFKRFKENKQYIFFDLDVVIRSDIKTLLRKNFTVIKAWWRQPAHTPLNSSIISWVGDLSHIYNKFYQDEDYSRVKYWRGIDEFIYKEIEYQTYDKVCWSWMFDKKELNYPVCLFNQSFESMRSCEWAQKYLLLE